MTCFLLGLLSLSIGGKFSTRHLLLFESLFVIARVKTDAKSEKNSLTVDRKIDLTEITDVVSVPLPASSQLRENDGLSFESLYSVPQPSSFSSPQPTLASLLVYLIDSSPLMFRGDISLTNSISAMILTQLETVGRKEKK